MSTAVYGADLRSAATRVAHGLAQAQTATSSTSSSAGTTSTSSSASTDSTGISSSDFLTLLVTEMKNQDPTQPTDPNAYIQQLVGVNSLQQLISINQDLSSVGSSGTGTTTNGGVTSASGVS